MERYDSTYHLLDSAIITEVRRISVGVDDLFMSHPLVSDPFQSHVQEKTRSPLGVCALLSLCDMTSHQHPSIEAAFGRLIYMSKAF